MAGEKRNVEYKTIHFPTEGVIIKDLGVTPLGNDRFRLDESPTLLESISYGDVIEVREDSAGSLYFACLVQKSGLVRHEYLLSTEVTRSALFQEFLDRVSSGEGYWEVALGGMFVIYLPMDSEIKVGDEIDALVAVI